jgi:hypothetical protein
MAVRRDTRTRLERETLKLAAAVAQRTLDRKTRILIHHADGDRREMPMSTPDPDIASLHARMLGRKSADRPRAAARADARAWLLTQLKDGPVPSVEAKRDARAVGISGKTLERAWRDLGVKPEWRGRTSALSLP